MGITLSPYEAYEMGYTRITKAFTMGGNEMNRSKTLKNVVVRIED